MKRFWLFRSNLRIVEGYHIYKILEDFKNNCWDFYLLQGIYYLENNYFDEFVVFRLNPKGRRLQDIVFDINGKKFIQKWVDSFKEVYKYSSPDITMFRGGFLEYDEVVKENPVYFGKKLYLGAGRRLFPQYGGKYDVILLESERDFNKSYNCISFYKTANPNIFKPLFNQTKKYDLCLGCNYTQQKYKGQEFFISSISKSSFLKGLKIVHAGNEPDVGKELCRKYSVDNIEFVGWLERTELNKLLNQSKVGIVTSNLVDGCPRISTEILMSGTPLLIRDQTRLLRYYKQSGVVEFNDKNIEKKIIEVFSENENLVKEVMAIVNTRLSISTICRKNLDMWKV